MNLVFVIESSYIESLEFFYNYLMDQQNENWKDVMSDYRQVLLSLHETLLDMKKEYSSSHSNNHRKEAYQCLLKLVSTYSTEEPEYEKYATECSKEFHQPVISSC